MKNQHRGDSLSKKIARFELYVRIRAWVGSEQFRKMRFCYLASFEGGDASVLEAMGVPAQNQLAVDFDERALRLFSEVYPNVPTFLGPIERMPPDRIFDCIFLDFCANLSDATVRSCVLAARRLKRATGSVFAVALLRGRENGWQERIEQASRALRDGSAKMRTRVASMSGRASAPSDFDIERLDGEARVRRLADGRLSIIYDAVGRDADDRRLAFMTLTRIAYSSADPVDREKGKPGTPMSIGAWHAVAAPSSWSMTKFNKTMSREAQLNGFMLEQWGRLGLAKELGLQVATPALREPYRTRLDRLLSVHGAPMLDLVGYETRSTLARAVTHADQIGVDAALAFNMTRAEIAALRAHVTRGSYDEKDVEERRGILTSMCRQAEAHGIVERVIVDDDGDVSLLFARENVH